MANRELQYSLRMIGVLADSVRHEDAAISFVKVWETALNVLAEGTYSTQRGDTHIYVDWSSAVKVAKETSRLNAMSGDELAEIAEQRLWPWQAMIDCTVVLSENYASDVDFESHARLHLEHYLFDCFLALNLAVPGSLELFGATLNSQDKRGGPTTLDLSSVLMGWAWEDSLESGWPQILAIDLDKTWSWIRRVNIGKRQRALSRSQRALFALLHAYRGDAHEEGNLVWMAHALEALYDTPTALTYNFARERISNILDLPPRRKKWFNKQLRSFYDLRSGFVHGDLPISHPLAIGAFDESVDDQIMALMNANRFALAIIIATLQKLILNGWAEFEFVDKWHGVPLYAAASELAAPGEVK